MKNGYSLQMINTNKNNDNQNKGDDMNIPSLNLTNISSEHSALQMQKGNKLSERKI